MNLFLALASKAGAGRNQAADDDIFFQADQIVNLAGNGRVNQHPGRFLERSGGKERIGGERRLGNAQKQGFANSFFILLLFSPLIFFNELRLGHNFTGQKIGFAGILNIEAREHLPDNHFNVFGVELLALGRVDVKDFFDDVALHLQLAFVFKKVVEIQTAFG